MRFIGLDPSLNSTGIVVVDFSKTSPFLVDWELVQPGTKGSMPSRLFHIRRCVFAFCEKHSDVSVAGVEDGIVHRSRKVSRLLAQARGAALEACYAAGVRRFADITPFGVKEAATGHRCASKEDVAKGVQEKIIFPPGIEWKDDLTDAASVALAAHQLPR